MRAMPPSAWRIGTQLLVGAHMLFGSNAIWSAVYQQTEELIGVRPDRFSLARAATRSAMQLVALLLALALVRGFGVLLALVGGLFFTLLGYAFPTLAYYRLANRFHPSDWARRRTRHWQTALMLALFSIACLVFVGSTLVAIDERNSQSDAAQSCFANWSVILVDD